MKKMNLIVRDTLLTMGLLMAIVILLLLIATPVVLINNLVITDRGYIVMAAMSMILFTISVITLITQKRLLINSVMGLVASVFFLASSIFGYKYGIFTNPIGTSFFEFGIGIMCLSNGVGLNDMIKNSLVTSAEVPKLKKNIRISFIVGIMALLFGIFFFINGFYHLY